MVLGQNAGRHIRAVVFTRSLPAAKLEQVPLFLAELCRGVSRHQLGCTRMLGRC